MAEHTWTKSQLRAVAKSLQIFLGEISNFRAEIVTIIQSAENPDLSAIGDYAAKNRDKLARLNRLSTSIPKEFRGDKSVSIQVAVFPGSIYTVHLNPIEDWQTFIGIGLGPGQKILTYLDLSMVENHLNRQLGDLDSKIITAKHPLTIWGKDVVVKIGAIVTSHPIRWILGAIGTIAITLIGVYIGHQLGINS